MKDGKLELTDWRTIIELAEGTAKVVTNQDLYYKFHPGERPNLEELRIIRKPCEGLIVVMCAENYRLIPLNEKRNGNQVFRYEGKSYDHYDIEEGFNSLDMALREK